MNICLPHDSICVLSQDSLYYLDADGSSEEEKPAIVVKQLVLALPENRLATLLSQQKFEEAEAFARKFDLDPEVGEWGRGQGMAAYTMYMYQYIMCVLIYGLFVLS